MICTPLSNEMRVWGLIWMLINQISMSCFNSTELGWRIWIKQTIYFFVCVEFDFLHEIRKKSAQHKNIDTEWNECKKEKDHLTPIISELLPFNSQTKIKHTKITFRLTIKIVHKSSRWDNCGHVDICADWNSNMALIQPHTLKIHNYRFHLW